jgi:hypothetical protein
MTAPSVASPRASELAAWLDASSDVAQPPIASGGSGSTFTQWKALGSAPPSAPGETLLLGCAATPVPGWVEDMRPTVDDRTRALTNACAERMVGAPVEARETSGHLALRLAGTPEDGPQVGLARTFVGFGEHQVFTCFALCASKKPGATRTCDAVVLAAHLEGSMPPPPPGLVLGAATWAVHHPSEALVGGAVVVLTLGAIAVAFRRRPRSRI